MRLSNQVVEGEPGIFPPGFARLWQAVGRRFGGRPPSGGPGAVLVRHGMPTVRPEVPPAEWSLDPERIGDVVELAHRLDLGAKTTIATSDERKAIETAEVLSGGRPVVARQAFREVAKPWFEDPEALRLATIDYLGGASLDGWEPMADAVARFDVGLAEVRGPDPLVVVTHGTVMTAWLAARVALADPGGFWEALRTPDAYPVRLP